MEEVAVYQRSYLKRKEGRKADGRGQKEFAVLISKCAISILEGHTLEQTDPSLIPCARIHS